MVKKFLIHIRPKFIYRDAYRFTNTFGLGGILILLYLILIISGIILMLFYIPHPDKAYISMKKIINILPYGRLIRNIHRLSGDLMIFIGFLHILRIATKKVFDNKYRIKNWQIGILMFLLLFLFNFSGYLLPWDTISYWGATIVLNIINHIPILGEKLRIILSGGKNINELTLLRFYTYHIVVLPIIFTFLLMVHFYLIRKAKGVKIQIKSEKIPVSKLYEREILTVLIVIIVLTVISFKNNIYPIMENANSGSIPAVLKAPWYFAGIQFLLTYFPPLIAGVIVPILYSAFMFFFYKINKLSIFIIINLCFVIFTVSEIVK
jgi:quinol-cytochrome oxidoreductase complex cytochrome b subunit